MDGKGRWRDSVFVGRLWRGVKYEEASPKAYPTVSDARAALQRYFASYNARRPHSRQDKQTPDEFYFAARLAFPQAA